MTTDSESVAAEERSIDELSKIVRKSGYSLLTDAEIDRLMAYNAQVAVHAAQTEAQIQALRDAHQSWIDETRVSSERAEAAFLGACAIRAEFAAVSDEQA